MHIEQLRVTSWRKVETACLAVVMIAIAQNRLVIRKTQPTELHAASVDVLMHTCFLTIMHAKLTAHPTKCHSKYRQEASLLAAMKTQTCNHSPQASRIVDHIWDTASCLKADTPALPGRRPLAVSRSCITGDYHDTLGHQSIILMRCVSKFGKARQTNEPFVARVSGMPRSSVQVASFLLATNANHDRVFLTLLANLAASTSCKLKSSIEGSGWLEDWKPQLNLRERIGCKKHV